MSTGRQARQALIHGSPTQSRVVREFGYDDKGNRIPLHETTGLYYSHNLAVRQAQKLLDQLHERYPNPPGVLRPVFKQQAVRAGKEANVRA